MAFRFEVSYARPSIDRDYLGYGWGMSDVRGPYLILDYGHIYIPSILLHDKITSNIYLTFSLSNRSLYDTVEIICSHSKILLQETVLRNSDVTFALRGIVKDDIGQKTIEIRARCLDIRDSQAILKSMVDLVTIDKLVVERNSS